MCQTPITLTIVHTCLSTRFLSYTYSILSARINIWQLWPPRKSNNVVPTLWPTSQIIWMYGEFRCNLWATSVCGIFEWESVDKLMCQTPITLTIVHTCLSTRLLSYTYSSLSARISIWQLWPPRKRNNVVHTLWPTSQIIWIPPWTIFK